MDPRKFTATEEWKETVAAYSMQTREVPFKDTLVSLPVDYYYLKAWIESLRDQPAWLS